jgi:hypothetical protein
MAGERKWSIAQNFPRCYICDSVDAARALREQKVSKLPKA